MHEDFEASWDCHHCLKTKHTTPLLSGRAPLHPGTKPEDESKMKGWRAKADAYAKHWLLLFRPETIEDCDLGYTWEDLESYIQRLQACNSFISKSRLMIMENHLKGLKVAKVCERMLKDYKSRNRRQWTKAERMKFRMDEEFRMGNQSRCLWDDLVKSASTKMTDAEMRELKDQIHCDSKTRAMLTTLFQKHESCNQWSQAHKASLAASINTSGNPAHICSKALQLNGYDVGHTADNDVQPPSTNSPSGTPDLHVARTIKEIESRDSESASQQVQLVKLYAKQFKQEGMTAPQMTMIHGPPGVGKSTVRNALIDLNQHFGNKDLRTANFAINCISMQGKTTASLIFKHGGSADVSLSPSFNASVIEDLKKDGFTVSSVVFVEEVSTQAPWHVANLSSLCKEITKVFGEEFGGCHVIFFGDFTQLGPVKAGHSIPQAVFHVHASKEIKRILKIKDKSKSKSNSKLGTPYRQGVDIFTKVRWFELNKQQRAITDELHSKFVEGNYFGDQLHLHKIKDHIPILSEDDMDDIKWAMAPVLVATNRARHTITHPRALHLARLKETVVLRWVTDFDNWQNKPKKEHFHDVLQDPCFWEYFVRGASGFITKNISKKLHVVNGQKITYHSVVVDAKWQDWLTNKIHQHTDGTEPIDLPEPPLAVNVELKLNDLMNPKTKDALRTIALSVRTVEGGSAGAKEYVVLPITPKREEWQKDKDGKALN